jgi:hypothetical protein
MTRLMWATVSMVLVGATGGASGRLDGQDVARSPVPIDKVVEAFQTNEIRADAVYVGKEVEVAGRVARVIVSRHGSGGGDGRKQEYVVELQVRPLDVSRVTVQCSFAGAAREQLAGLKAGQEVVIRGTGGRLVVYTGDYKRGEKDYTEIPFRDCTLVAPK